MRVRVWRNSRRRGWSVRPVGSHRSPLVLPALCLRDVTFHVNEGLYERHRRTGLPATFAWAEGEMCAEPDAERTWRWAMLRGNRFACINWPYAPTIADADYARFGGHLEVCW